MGQPDMSSQLNPRLMFPGDSELAGLMREFDWSKTPLGAPSGWSQSLKTAVRILLTSRQPFWLGWGSDLTYLYNDAYKSIIGGRHPHAFGKPFREVWPETWHLIGPMADKVMTRDEGTYVEAMLLIMERHGYQEETYYTFSYSPVPGDDGRTAGLICANTDDTRRVIGERQIATLRELAERMANARSWREAAAGGVEALDTNTRDLPFTLLYLAKTREHEPELAAASPGTEALVDHPAWRCAEVIRSGKAVTVDLAAFGVCLPKGSWPQAPTQAVVLPIQPSGEAGRAGALVVGLNRYRKLDESYRGFLDLACGQIASGIANADAYEQEKKRAESLAELDRAKTAFFSNVSHEFRTPLTLMLGPVEDILARAEDQVFPDVRELLRVVHRNGLRLHRLVNSLLDFSRIEAGRVQAVYEPTDLATFTADLASNFRSACERAGLALLIDCPALPHAVNIDREMWEKIVLNLISNAFKFTFEGQIAVELRPVGDRIELRVRDTGTGIVAEELPHLFERFHRVRGARGRTEEGTGIGLALVHELVKLHGGTVSVTSEVARGTTFSVLIPGGTTHLPPDRLAASRSLPPTALGSAAYIEEALQWLSGDVLAEAGLVTATERSGVAHILVADDNADMREYVRRLLARHWTVTAVGDGQAALEAIRQRRPDLLLADVMMPRLDGFELLRRLRAQAETRSLPVILLSARAGEEARVEGVERGADDYLVKPFSARELIARVNSHLELARIRDDAMSREQAARAQAEEANRAKDEFLAMLGHELRNPLGAIATAVGVLEETGKQDEGAASARAVIARQVGQLGRIVDDLLDVARVTSGRILLNRCPLDLGDLVQRSLHSLSTTGGAARHRLTISLEPVWISADETRIEQVVTNLVGNAWKFTAPGGAIHVLVGRDGDEAVLQVADNGRGISPSFLPRVFELFAQGERGAERAEGGLGLGLTLVRRLVELHGGTATAASDGIGKGATFTVRFPAIDAPRAVMPHAPRAHGVTERRRVLIIEDNADGREMLRTLLSLEGHEVYEAENGASGIEKVVALEPDIALIDIGLPGADGYEVARRIRAMDAGHRVVLVALTGYGQAEDKRRAVEAGFDAHLVKPVATEALRSVLGLTHS